MKTRSQQHFFPCDELMRRLYEQILRGLEVTEGEIVIVLDDRDWHILTLALTKEWFSDEAFEQAVSDTLCLLGWEAFLSFKRTWKHSPVAGLNMVRDHIQCISFTYMRSGIATHWVKRMLLPDESIEDFKKQSAGLLGQIMELLRNYQKPTQKPHVGFKLCIDDADPNWFWESRLNEDA